MGERKIKLKELVVGMVLARPLFSLDGELLMKENTVFDNLYYEMFIFNDITELYIQEEDENDRQEIEETENNQEIKAIFEEDVFEETEIESQLRMKNSMEEYEYFDEENNQVNEYNFVAEKLEKEKSRTVKRDDFANFENEFAYERDIIKDQLISICNGKAVDLMDVYQLTDNLLNKMKFRNDIFSFMYAISDDDERLYTHSINVSILCYLLGRWLDITGLDLIILTCSGMLHDVGKLKIPAYIVNKKEQLTDEEFEIYKTHTFHGYKILKNQPDIPKEVSYVALMHHEKTNGKGYPMNIKSERIHKFAKLVTICDTFDALTATRISTKKLSPFDVIKKIGSFGDTETTYLRVFLRNVAHNYIGSWVLLSDGRQAEVVYINDKAISKPIVRDLEGNIIDMNTEKLIFIENLI